MELTVTDGMLHIEARREEEKQEERGFMRRELRNGSFTRSLPLPEGVVESDIKAGYKDGILEIRIHVRACAEFIDGSLGADGVLPAGQG